MTVTRFFVFSRPLYLHDIDIQGGLDEGDDHVEVVCAEFAAEALGKVCADK